MSAATAVYVYLRGDLLIVGRLAASRRGSPRWRTQSGLEALPSTATALPLMSRTLSDAQATVDRLRGRFSLDQLRRSLAGLSAPYGCSAVAQDLAGSSGPEQRAAVMLTVLDSDYEFVLDGHQIICTDPEQRRIEQQASANQQQEAVLAEELRQLRTQLSTFGRCQSTASKRLIDSLEGFAYGRQTPSGLWLEALGPRATSRSGVATAAARALADLGIWDGHEDLPLLRSGLLEPWPDRVQLERVRQPNGRDQTAFVTLDNDEPDEVDDAIWATIDGDKIIVKVAIASPTDWLVSGDDIDRGARSRVATLYHPRHLVPMLPSSLLQMSSLDVDVWRPALVATLTLRPDGTTMLTSLAHREICVRQAWTYNEAQAALDAGDPVDWLVAMQQATEYWERQRIDSGAYLLYRNDVEVRCQTHQAPSVVRAPQWQMARRLVAEAMVQMCAAVATYCQEHRLAVPFRTQRIRPNPPLNPGLYSDPADIQTMLGHLGPARTQTKAGRHDILGLEAYVQVTSPLRRYVDLVAHQQILAALHGEPAPMSARDIEESVSQVSPTIRSHRAHVRRSQRYFQLLNLAKEGLGARMKAQVIRAGVGSGRNIAVDPIRVLEVELPSYLGPVGTWLDLQVVEVDASAGRVGVRTVGD